VILDTVWGGGKGKGREAWGRGHGAERMGQRAWGRGHGAEGMGKRASGTGQKAWGRGYGAEGMGQRAWGRGQKAWGCRSPQEQSVEFHLPSLSCLQLLNNRLNGGLGSVTLRLLRRLPLGLVPHPVHLDRHLEGCPPQLLVL